MAYTDEFDPNEPLGSDPAEVDNEFRKFRTQVKERLDTLVEDIDVDPLMLNAHSAVKVSRSSALAIDSAATEIIEWDDEIHDSDAWWAVGTPTKLIVPAAFPAGRPYLVLGNISVALPTDGNLWRLSILKNGSSIANMSAIAVGAALGVHVHVAAIVIADPEDYFELQTINPDSSSRNYATGEPGTHFEAVLL